MNKQEFENKLNNIPTVTPDEIDTAMLKDIETDNDIIIKYNQLPDNDKQLVKIMIDRLLTTVKQ